MNDTLVESKKPQQVDEFETRPVPEASQKGHRAFWGMYSGEHAAGTEFMIGPLFLLAGASLQDIFLGLLVGNSRRPGPHAPAPAATAALRRAAGRRRPADRSLRRHFALVRQRPLLDAALGAIERM